MKRMHKLVQEFKTLKLFDIVWLTLCTIGITLISIHTNNNPLAILASIMGVIYVILNGCRLSVAFLFGIINTFTYAIVSYQNGLYGDFMMNMFYSCPCCVIGLVTWFKASEDRTTAKVSTFQKKERVRFVTLIASAILIYGLILFFLKDSQPYLDATTTVLSMSAYLCLILRKKEVWYLFNISNILSIVMWSINCINSEANLSILLMYMIYTANSLLNTVRWERASRPLLEIDILLYKGEIDFSWIEKLVKDRSDLEVNIYEYQEECKQKKNIAEVRKIPKRIQTYGGAYNYIISKVKGKYFMLLDNQDYLNPKLFQKVVSKELLEKDYQMIKTNHFYSVDENNKKIEYNDDYTGTPIELENKIIDRKIVPYFFGSRIYHTKFIKKHKIRFNNTNMYNDVYPNIVLARNLDMKKVFFTNVPFYIRYRNDWAENEYGENDLREMIESLLKLNVPKERILIRLVDAYNYSVHIRNCKEQYFMDTLKDYFDIEEFEKAVQKTEKQKKKRPAPQKG